jgi:hypothetical protein
LVSLTDLSRTGGVINAFDAAKIAATLEPASKSPKKKKTPKPSLKNKNG